MKVLPIRVLAMIYPIERHVGHWACPSPSIDLVRVLMEGKDLECRVLETFRRHDPQVIAIIGKRPGEYLDLLDRLASREPSLTRVPRVYRCQNTVLAARLGTGGGASLTREELEIGRAHV